MSKLISLMIAGAFALGCGGAKKETTTTTTTTDTTTPDTTTTNTDATDTTQTDTTQPAGDGTPCAQEIALECPEGQIDGCLKTPPEGDTHTCVAN